MGCGVTFASVLQMIICGEKKGYSKQSKFILTHKRPIASCAEPDHTQQNAASDQGIHYLLTECSIKI